MKIIVVANQKGGEGKTTLAMNLSAHLAERQHRVLAVDVDPQESIAAWDNAAERTGHPLGFDTAATTDPETLKALRSTDYDYIVIDSAGKLGNDVTAHAVADADFVLLPSTSAADMNLLPLVETIERTIKPAGRSYAVVLNRLDPRAITDEPEARATFNQLDIPVMNSAIRSYKAHQTASGTGLTSDRYARTRSEVKATKDFQDLTNELLAKLGA